MGPGSALIARVNPDMVSTICDKAMTQKEGKCVTYTSTYTT